MRQDASSTPARCCRHRRAAATDGDAWRHRHVVRERVAIARRRLAPAAVRRAGARSSEASSSAKFIRLTSAPVLVQASAVSLYPVGGWHWYSGMPRFCSDRTSGRASAISRPGRAHGADDELERRSSLSRGAPRATGTPATSEASSSPRAGRPASRRTAPRADRRAPAAACR